MKRKWNINCMALKRLFGLCPQFYVVSFLRILFTALSPYINLLMSAAILDEIAGARNWRKLLFLALFTVTADLMVGIISSLLAKLASDFSSVLNDRETEAMNRAAYSLNLSDVESVRVTTLRQEIQNAKSSCHGTWCLKYTLFDLLSSIISFCLSFGIFSEMLWIVQTQTNEFDLFSLFLFLAILVLFGLKVAHTFRSARLNDRAYDAKLNAVSEGERINGAFESYQLGKDVRIYGFSDLILGIKRSILERRINAQTTESKVNFQTSVVNSFLGCGIRAATYVYISIYALRGIIGVGSVLKYVGCIELIISAVVQIFYRVNQLSENTHYVESYLDFLSLESAEEEPSSVSEDFDELRVKEIRFTYPDAERTALEDISLTIKKGEKIAVVGENGSGKTTFIKLLMGLYPPDSGQVCLDDGNAAPMSLFTAVFQDFKLLPFTAGQNISLNNDNSSETVNRIKTCLSQSGLPDFSPDAYLYKDFEESGIEISGGEAQKIAIARALYRDSPVMILDEPTAALDPISEAQIYERFNEISADKTVLYISHRLSSCRFADRIFVFHEGHLMEEGTHETLLKRQGKYAELWEAQAQYYQNG